MLPTARSNSTETSADTGSTLAPVSAGGRLTAMPNPVRPRLDDVTADAIRRAAERAGISEAAYVRQALRRQLRADGVEPRKPTPSGDANPA